MVVHEYCFVVYFYSPHPLQVPPKVTGVSVSKDMKEGKPTLRVTWTSLQNAANLSEYRVQYKRNGTLSWGYTVSAQPYSNSTLLPELLPGTAYNVRVRAVSAFGEGEWSKVLTETTFNSELIHLHIQKLESKGNPNPNLNPNPKVVRARFGSGLNRSKLKHSPKMVCIYACTMEFLHVN